MLCEFSSTNILQSEAGKGDQTEISDFFEKLKLELSQVYTWN